MLILRLIAGLARPSVSGGKRQVCTRWAAILLLFAVIIIPATKAQSISDNAATNIDRDIDPKIAAAISSIAAIDDHAHPVLPPPNDSADRNFDALPVDNMEPQTDPVAWRPDNPQLTVAWKALWGFDKAAPLDVDGMKRLNEARAKVKSREGQRYADWVLDQAGIGVMLSNRVAMGQGLAGPRFQWVPYVDALLFPLDNTDQQTTPDKKQFFPLEERLRAQYLKAVGIVAVPATLAEYLTRVVTPTLERQKSEGAVAEKFEVAYLRGFDFADTPRSEAERIYSKWVGLEHPDSVEYKALQDFLFRYIAAECGRLGMPVHLHTMSGGGGYFDIAKGNPLLLESVFDDVRSSQDPLRDAARGMAIRPRSRLFAAETQCLPGSLAAGAHIPTADHGRLASGMAGDLSGQGDVRHGRLSIFRIYGMGRSDMDSQPQCPPGDWVGSYRHGA